MAHHRGHAVVAEPARVNGWRHELVAEGVHHQQWGGLRGVAEVVTQLAFGQRRTGGRLHADNPVFLLLGDFLANEREG